MLLKSCTCKRAFHAIAIWLPVSHLERGKSGASKDQDCAPEELEVSLQHLLEYKNTKKYSKSKVLEEVDAPNCKEEEESKEIHQREANEMCAWGRKRER